MPDHNKEILTPASGFSLLPFSQIVWEDMRAGRGAAWEFAFILEARGINPTRLRNAVEEALDAHPVFRMQLTSDGRQHYDGKRRTPYFDYTISQAGDVTTLAVRFHRVLGDAASLAVLMADVDNAYAGRPVAPDSYISYLRQHEALPSTAGYQQSADWLRRHYDALTAPTFPAPDASPLSVAPTTCATESVALNSVPESAALYAAVALAIMDYNGSDSAALTWGYLGRETAEEQRIFGSLNRDVPFMLHRGAKSAMLDEARQQVASGIVHSRYPYTFMASDRAPWRYAVNVQVQQAPDMRIGSTRWTLLPPPQHEARPAHCFFDVVLTPATGCLEVTYSAAHYRPESVQRFLALTQKHLQELASAEKRFMERLADNVEQHPHRVILRDATATLTYQQLDSLSGRVYAWLQGRGVGREDVVMIHLQRGVTPVAALVGVWKAGGVAVLTDEATPAERLAAIRRDCRPHTLIDDAAWADITVTPPLSGRAPTMPHDASHIVYTSGSEGTPKGIILEYGKLDISLKIQAHFWDACLRDDDASLMLGPLDATLSLTFIYFALTHGMLLDIAPYALARDYRRCLAHIRERHITVAGLPPTYLQMVPPEEWHLRFIVVGGDNVRRLYSPHVIISNTYGSTESSMGVCNFLVDRLYDNTPIGQPSPYIRTVLLDDDDQPVPPGQAGELCHENPFTRGYVGSEAYNSMCRNGLYHTGDIARVNAEGQYVIIGRKSRMIKIHGNRIEPAEVEAAVKRVAGIDWAYCKGFVEGERSYICVYHTSALTLPPAELRRQLMDILPPYMLPSHFVRIDTVPYLPNGKVDHQALLPPALEESATPYEAPRNEVEARLCEGMAQVLGVERVGRHDDYFLLGADSMSAIRLIGQCGVEGLTVPQLYQHRTPAAIAAALTQPSSSESLHQAKHQ